MSKARNLSKVIVDTSGVVDRDSLDVETVAKTGSYNDLTDKPTITSGTVTSVAASAGTGISVSGSPITSSGTITITNTAPDQTVALTAGTGINTSGTYPNFTITNSAPDQTVSLTGAGTSVVTGTYPSFTVTTNDQYVGTVTGVSGTAPIASSGGTTPAISISQATTSTDGYLSSTDWNSFNGKYDIPSVSGNTGKFLTTDGSATSWATVDALPDQTGNSGKYLTTDGTDPSWATLDTDANSTTKGLYEHSNTISANYSITSGNNAMTAGTITINSGVTVTVPSGSTWVIV